MADCFCHETVLASKEQAIILPNVGFYAYLSLVNRRLRITDFAPKSKSQTQTQNFQSLSLNLKSLFETSEYGPGSTEIYTRRIL